MRGDGVDRRRIVFVGLGKMGAPMARHLAATGHAVQGVEPSAVRRGELGAAGIPLHASLAEALDAVPAELVISSLPDDTALGAVARGLAAVAAPGTVWIDTSTVSVAASRAAAALAAARGLPYLRAPVSGNASMAEAAQLTVLASGEAGLFERCRPLLACWGPQQLHVGAADEARACKLALNLMVAATSAMLAEALVLGQRAGVSREALWRVIEASPVASPLLKAKAPALRRHDYSPTFSVGQMRKDLALILDQAAALGIELPLAADTDAALAAAEQGGDAAADYAVIVRAAERRAGLDFPSLPPGVIP